MQPIRAALKISLAALLVTGLSHPAPAAAASGPTWHSSLALIGTPKYPDGFKHFDYVDPNAPKGGILNLSQTGSFDTFNPILSKGDAATGLGLVFESLFTPSADEVEASYGLLAEAVSYPPDISSATFRLRKAAKFADGTPVTPEDVVWSFENAVDLNPQQHFYYRHVKSAKKTGPDEVTFTFDQKNNRELPSIVGQLLVLPRHWWEARGKNGRQRSIKETTLEPPLGSGPYRIASVEPGSRIVFERNADYWGKDLNVNVGENNFDRITYTYFADRNVEFQAFKSGNVDFWYENRAKRWATEYNFPAARDGRITREELPNPYRALGIMVGFVPNLRQARFQDWRVRRALNYCFDFEELNRTIFYNQYQRVDSYFFGTPLAAPGIPSGAEKAILKSIRDKVPDRVFTQAYTNPVGGTPEKLRDNLRKAVELFRQAGYEIRDTGMVDAKTGKPFSFEILLNGETIAPVALALANNLNHQVGVARDLLDRHLPVLGGVADVVRGRVQQQREALADRVHDRHRLVDRQRGLGQPGDLGRVAHLEVGDVLGGLHQLDVPRGLACGALDLLVPGVPDQQDVVVLGREPTGLVVHLGDQRAGRVDGLQPPLLRLLVHLRGDAVGREHHRRALRHLVELLDEDRAARLEVGDHVLVVHDLLAHVHGGAVQVQRLLDGDHGPVHAGAVAARRREQHAAAVRLTGGQDGRIPRSEVLMGPIVGAVP